MDPYARLVDKMVSYQVVKYILLMLNIMLVTTTAILIVIVCLLPIMRTNSGTNYEAQVINLVRCLSIYEIDTIRIFRHAVLGISAAIIINQSLAVYGLFRERPGLIMFSTTLLGMLTQVIIFVLPTNAFLLLLVYIVLSIVYIVLLNRILEMTKSASRTGRSSNATGMLEQQKTCGCRCTPTNSYYQPATIISPTRKPSMPGQYYQSGGASYYYGSLGRRAREPRPALNSMTNRMSNDASHYAAQQQQPQHCGAGQYGNFKHLNRNSNPSTLLNNNNNSSNNNNNNATGEMFTTNISGQFAPRLESPNYNYINKTKQI